MSELHAPWNPREDDLVQAAVEMFDGILVIEPRINEDLLIHLQPPPKKDE